MRTELRATLLLAALALAACSEAPYRERWLPRLVQSGEYERALSLYAELPEATREEGDLRMQVVFASIGRHGLSHHQVPHLVALFASGKTAPIWGATAQLVATKPELARDLLDVGEALCRTWDGSETRGLIAATRLLGVFALLASEGGGAPPADPSVVSNEACARFLAALRFAAESPPSRTQSVSGVERVRAFASDVDAELESFELTVPTRTAAVRAWLAAESERP